LVNSRVWTRIACKKLCIGRSRAEPAGLNSIGLRVVKARRARCLRTAEFRPDFALRA
jgi:hypothetical protein